eukprot:CAMPEP_0172548250 /NCGR_PEP_ID=MMETSP1067-20121228/17596_1 /TAXON_ID=265564 ORGANISM="Thalassiosira punctigera, Strain Tpunct2005C2" /NCGR_SAMPLE_ID=MMETSP1067 /ASSEMBLY_ACC=CAM_ASM_000444 /LENGTH=131 /DNA_ID=CAMNT_0013335449 /DNA_START=285 /DNA_END=677 /DNA_ORIENTATION=+
MVYNNARDRIDGGGGGGVRRGGDGAAANPARSLILMVDPYSTGCMVGQEISKRGYPIMAVWTKGFAPEMKSITHVPVSCRDLRYVAQIDDLDHWSLDDLVANIEREASKAARKMGKPDDYFNIAGCMAGGE